MVIKNDLSAGLAKVDLKAMIHTSKVAVRELIECINHNIAEIRNTSFTEDYTRLSLNGKWLREKSESLEIACSTLATLQAAIKKGEEREIEIVR